MLSVWRCKFESVKKCESGWSKEQYVCDTIMLPLCVYRTMDEWNKCFQSNYGTKMKQYVVIMQ